MDSIVAYIITNHKTDNENKQYIGITKQQIMRRYNQHWSEVKRGSKNLLHCAMRKYGKDAFTIEQIGSADSWDELLELERELICKHKTFVPDGYNLTLGGEGVLGLKYSDESKIKKGFIQVELDGVRYFLNDLAKRHNLNYYTIYDRHKSGKSGSDLVSALCYSSTNNANSEEQNINELSKITGINRGTLYTRYYKGLREDKLTAPNQRPPLSIDVKEIADVSGLPVNTIRTRYYKGKRGDELLATKQMPCEIVVDIDGVCKNLADHARLNGLKPKTVQWRFRQGMRGAELIAPLKRNRGLGASQT